MMNVSTEISIVDYAKTNENEDDVVNDRMSKALVSVLAEQDQPTVEERNVRRNENFAD